MIGTVRIQDAINHYHDLLTDEVAKHADEQLRSLLFDRTLYFGDRPLCVVLRPHFYFEHDWQFLKQGLQGILGAFHRLHNVVMRDKDYRKQLLLEDYEERMFSFDLDAPVPWTSSRMDTFFMVDKRSLKCVEYNAETPAGIGYNDVLAEVFDQLEPMKLFQKQYSVRSTLALGTLTDAIISAYREWGGKEKPQIGILDWDDVPTLNEHSLTQDHFERAGYPTIMADPRTLEYRDGKLMAGDFLIDIIYKRVLFSELNQRMGTHNPMLDAVRDHAVFITNSPSAKLLAKKASLAFLSDERNRDLFTAEHHAFINAHIPWTRVIEDRQTFYGDQSVDLLAFVADHRERFVLKPNDEYGGKGVVLGWEVTDEEWASTLQTALHDPYVVQERVDGVQRDFPTMIDGQLDISERFLDADPYVFGGTNVHSCLTRVSSKALLNVTAGGGSVVPTYIIRKD